MSSFITTTNGSRVYFSDEDVFTTLANTWTEASDGYAKRYYEKALGGGKRERWVKYFHREVIAAKDGEIVDHINQDKLDNRRDNLRIASKSLNALNSVKSKGLSKYRGVFFNTQAGKFTARIKYNGTTHHLGLFTDEAEAGQAYLKIQKELTK